MRAASINKMATEHATTFISYNLFICIAISLLLPIADEGEAKVYDDTRSFPKDEKRLTREYNLRQGALRGLILKPGKQYDLQPVEMFLGIPYAASPTGNLRFMPPVSAPPWSGLRMATHFAPVCPQMFPTIKKGNPPSMARQKYLNRIKPFLVEESEDCLHLNIYVPYREQKPKKFPVLVFMHGDSFEWSSGNPYDGRILASYGNIMVITVNFRLGILGFMKPSLTEHVYGNNGLLDQLAALQWIKDNIQDLNGDPYAVTLMGHGTGAACVNFLMLSPISNGLFHRAILMSGSALSDAAMTKDPTQYTLQVAQSLGCNPGSKNMMGCLQTKPLSEIKKVQILAREFETPLGPVVAGSFIPSEPIKTMEAFPNLLSKYQLLTGVTEMERYHDFGVIELDHGILENQRDEFIMKLSKIVFEGAEDEALKDILKQYSPSKLDPQRWNVETNRDVILNLFSDARTLAPMISFSNYQSKANRQSYFYVFGHNSVSTDYAPLNKSVHGEEMPYVLGVPLGGANTHFHSEYTQQEKLLSEVVMRLWTNFVKNGSPNTQSVSEYHTFDKKQWTKYNVEWPEYNVAHQPYLKIDLPPSINSLYRSNYTKFWIESLPDKMKRYIVDPLFEFSPPPTTQKTKPSHRITDPVRTDPVRKIWGSNIYSPQVYSPQIHSSPVNPSHYSSEPTFGKLRPYSPPQPRSDTDTIYREIQAIKTPSRAMPAGLIEKNRSNTLKPKSNMPIKNTSATIALIVSLSILFLAINIGVCVILYIKKKKIRERTLNASHQPRAEIGEVDVMGQKCSKDDKTALKTLKNGCSVIKSMSINKMKGNSKKLKKKDSCKSPKSDDSGGFRERFQLRRHLSTSTLDAHTKVKDWITNEVMHRCSPRILRKSNSNLNDQSYITIKPFTRSEELLSDTRKLNKEILKHVNTNESRNLLAKTYSGKNKTSEKTTSTSALDSHSSLISNKQSTLGNRTNKSNDSLKSKGTDSIKSNKVSIAIDATPSARTYSILKQEPIELSKSLDQNELKYVNTENKLLINKSTTDDLTTSKDYKTYTNEIKLSLNEKTPLKIQHKHSSSDPVTDVNYELLMKQLQRDNEVVNILPPVTFRNEVNVTSRDEKKQFVPLSAAEALSTIKRRNFPKVLPDLPKAQKRLSLQSTALQTFRNYYGAESQTDKTKVPPQPPPRTTTLERRLAYKNSKPLSSFDVSNIKKITESETIRNYENMDCLLPQYNVNKSSNRSFESVSDRSHASAMMHNREYPKVIIASSDTLSSQEPTIFIKPTQSQVETQVGPRVRLPDDFHSHTSGSIKSFSSFCTEIPDEIDDEYIDNLAEDKLIQELVGGVESPTNIDVLDSKGPETIYEKKVEIIPVKINITQSGPTCKDYVCVSNLLLPELSGLEQTAQIKPNFCLNRLKDRSESINRPLEKAVKLKPKKSMKPTTFLARNAKSSSSSSGGSVIYKSDSNKLAYSNSGSSNDTETSTGTVKKVELK